MAKMVWITMQWNWEDPSGSGWPVKVYISEAAANAAVKEYKEADAEFSRLMKEDPGFKGSSKYNELLEIISRKEVYIEKRELVE